jgi:hypothetical protein
MCHRPRAKEAGAGQRLQDEKDDQGEPGARADEDALTFPLHSI